VYSLFPFSGATASLLLLGVKLLKVVDSSSKFCILNFDQNGIVHYYKLSSDVDSLRN
jgi:hypothetical protein